MRTHQNKLKPRHVLQNNLVIISKNTKVLQVLERPANCSRLEDTKDRGHGWLRTRSFATKDAMGTAGKM